MEKHIFYCKIKFDSHVKQFLELQVEQYEPYYLSQVMHLFSIENNSVSQ